MTGEAASSSSDMWGIGPRARGYVRTIADEFELSDHAARTREMWNADAPNWCQGCFYEVKGWRRGA
jgi:hypothetical protein